MKSTLYDVYCIFIYNLIGPSLFFQYYFTKNNMNCYRWASKLYLELVVKVIYNKECSVVRIDLT